MQRFMKSVWNLDLGPPVRGYAKNSHTWSLLRMAVLFAVLQVTHKEAAKLFEDNVAYVCHLNWKLGPSDALESHVAGVHGGRISQKSADETQFDITPPVKYYRILDCLPSRPGHSNFSITRSACTNSGLPWANRQLSPRLVFTASFHFQHKIRAFGVHSKRP